MKLPEFVWTGDLEDDCVCTSATGYSCHCEAMDKGDREWWFASVCRNGDEDDLFHSTSMDISPLTGPAARKLCEWIILADMVRRKAVAL